MYVPGVVKFTFIELVPEVHASPLRGDVLSAPKLPLVNVQPVEGEICQIEFPGIQTLPVVGIIDPELPVFVKVTVVV